jgi:hypothetical protein
VQALVEAGTIALLDGSRGRGDIDTGHSNGLGGSQRGPSSGGMRHTGDR